MSYVDFASFSFPLPQNSSIESDERMRQLEQLEKRSQASSDHQTQAVERFSKSSLIHLIENN